MVNYVQKMVIPDYYGLLVLFLFFMDASLNLAVLSWIEVLCWSRERMNVFFWIHSVIIYLHIFTFIVENTNTLIKYTVSITKWKLKFLNGPNFIPKRSFTCVKSLSMEINNTYFNVEIIAFWIFLFWSFFLCRSISFRTLG